ncbi:hypothetical protein Vau01_025200 [Virgisporangium aurantiacum]|uniref:Uncharacterized protein n=1 Tax=Virgisporangium aurantiacum TaxID=175570 RepID=A0A8J3Z0E6_9ACTN|nr:hypothetical protein Vau01_025200 [Virgisporangium aurantiacum]
MQGWTRGEVEVDFGAGPVVVERGLKVLALNNPVPMPDNGPINWSELDKLPDLITIMWSGLDRGVIAAAAGRGVRFLYWSDAAGEVDLSGTSAEHVRLGGVGLRGVRLPATVKRLQLNGPPIPDLPIEAPTTATACSCNCSGRPVGLVNAVRRLRRADMSGYRPVLTAIIQP